MKRCIKGFVVAFMLLSSFMAGCSTTSEKTGNDAKEMKETVLIYGRGSDSPSLDPQNETDGETFRVTANVYETLVGYEKDSTIVVPKLAKKWEVSPDGKTWTFHLKEGVTFHDGTPFQAEAVVYNFQRMMDKSHPQHQGQFAYYASTFNGFRGDGSIIEEVKAIDPLTVQFTLNKPRASFLSSLGIASFGIISPEALKKYGEKIGEHPVGTGPFKFVSWNPNESITLEKNANYWVAGLPKVNKVVFKVIPDNSARLVALKNGEIDLLDGMNTTDFQTLKSDSNLETYLRPSLNIATMVMNMEKKPFDNRKVRMAINHATNKQGIVDAFYAGLAEPAKNMMPPSLWGYNNDIVDYDYNLTTAKQLLAEAGYPNGFETELWVMSSARPYMQQPQKVAEAIKVDLEKIRIKVKIVPFEWATYLKKLKNAEHPMALIGWTGDNGDPDNFLYVLMDKDNAKPPAARNYSMYKSEELHKVLIEAQNLSDQAKRASLYMKAQEIIHEDAPTVPLAHSFGPMAGTKRMKGYVPHATGIESLAEVSIE